MSDATFHYREIEPPGVLAGHIRCIWRLRGPATPDPAPEPIIPDGCVEIVMNLGDRFARHADGAPPYLQPRRLLTGQLSSAIAIAPTGSVDLWGIRFQPWAAAAFLGVSGTELRDRMLTVDDASTALDRALAQAFDAPAGDRASRLIAGLAQRALHVHPIDRTLPALVSAISRERTLLSVRELGRRAGIGTRRLQAMFAERVGMTPKMLMRITRLQRALGIARSRPSLSWGAVAVEAGYYDQPHLNRDCRAIAGCSPSALVTKDPGLTEVFLDSD